MDFISCVKSSFEGEGNEGVFNLLTNGECIFEGEAIFSMESEDNGLGFGSWNPVTIDDIITNSEQIEHDAEQAKELDILISVSKGVPLPVDFNTMESTHACEFVGAYQFTDEEILGFRQFGARGSRQFGAEGFQQRAKPPTCHVPFFPILDIKYFMTLEEIDVLVFKIEEKLKEKEVSFRFIASECTWECSYLNSATHASFVVRVYRFPVKLCVQSRHYAVEIQQLDGDAIVIHSINKALVEELRDPETEAEEEDEDKVPALTSYSDTDIISVEQIPVPSIDNLKEDIVRTMKVGRMKAVLGSTQFACSIYSEQELAPPTEIDKNLTIELIKIVVASETNSEWTSQHAVWALASMSSNKDYIKMMMSLSEDLRNEFLEAFFALTRVVPVTYTTYTMRCKCVELLKNLLESDDKEQVVHILGGDEKIQTWKQSEFVIEACRKLGTSIV